MITLIGILLTGCNLFFGRREKNLEEELKKSIGITGISEIKEGVYNGSRVVIEAFVDEKPEREKVDSLISYNIEENDFNILSFVFDGYEYETSGNAKGYIKVHNLSKETLKSVKFQDVFVEGSDLLFEKIINDKIKKFNNTTYYRDNKFRKNKTQFSKINFKIKDAVMYFKNDEVIFVFPQYELFDNTYKMPRFRFKKSDIEHLLVKGI
ncbi:hypothetical protein [Fusobacterium sp. PH5-29]|uniref:hypothetical protein n=1 Tax=Fusobacterium sp. PH5-29 TaxID=1742400 RepID=UPI003D197F8C